MRKFNGILSGLILILFLAHGIMGAFQLIGAGNVISRSLSYIMVALVILHALIGVKLTADALRIQKKTGAGYFRRNLIYWARRISGLAIMVMILFHVTAFSYSDGGMIRLALFDRTRLAAQILLLISVAVHIITNVRPMLITFGIRGLRRWEGDILFVLSVILLFMGAAFVVYYIRWNGF